MQKKAYWYIRFSTLKQIKGDLLRRQLDEAASRVDHSLLTTPSQNRTCGVTASGSSGQVTRIHHKPTF